MKGVLALMRQGGSVEDYFILHEPINNSKLSKVNTVIHATKSMLSFVESFLDACHIHQFSAKGQDIQFSKMKSTVF